MLRTEASEILGKLAELWPGEFVEQARVKLWRETMEARGDELAFVVGCVQAYAVGHTFLSLPEFLVFVDASARDAGNATDRAKRQREQALRELAERQNRRNAERRAAEASWEKTRATLARLDDAEIKRRKAAAMASHPWLAVQWANADPRTSPMLGALVASAGGAA